MKITGTIFFEFPHVYSIAHFKSFVKHFFQLFSNRQNSPVLAASPMSVTMGLRLLQPRFRCAPVTHKIGLVRQFCAPIE